MPQTAPPSPFSAAGFFALYVYLFALFGFLTETFTELLGFKPYFSIVMGPAAVILAMLSGGFRRLSHPLVTMTILFLGWLTLASPFGYYRAGSLEALQDILLRSYSIIFLSVILVDRFPRVQKVFGLLTITCVIMQVLCETYSEYGPDGRLVLSFGSLSNPNDLATHLLALLPFCLYTMFTSRWFVVKPVMAVTAGLLLLTIMKTGSRGGLLSLAAMLGILFLLGSGKLRAVLAASIVLVSVAGLLLVPDMIWRRLVTSVVGDVGDEDTSYAIASREARRELVKMAIETTISHPLLGIGPGNFASYTAGQARDRGVRAGWQGTHNTYLQVSAEAGLPAMGLLIVMLGGSCRRLWRIYKQAVRLRQQTISFMALCLLTALVGLCVNLLFSHIAYRFYIPSLVGLTIAFDLSTMHLWRPASGPAPAAAAPAVLRPAWQPGA